MKELKGWWVIEEVEEDDGKTDVDDVDVETPAPA